MADEAGTETRGVRLVVVVDEDTIVRHERCYELERGVLKVYESGS